MIRPINRLTSTLLASVQNLAAACVYAKHTCLCVYSKVGMFNFYRAVIESVLTFSLIVWFGSSTAQQRSQINNITRVASKNIGYDLPTIDEIYVSRLQKKGLKILKDRLHPARHLFTPLPSGRQTP